MNEKKPHIAKDIIEQFLQGKYSIEERKNLNGWLKELPSDKADQFLKAFGEEIDAMEGEKLQEFTQKLKAKPGFQKVTAKKYGKEIKLNVFRNLRKIAASAVILIGVGLLAFLYFKNAENVMAVQEISVPKGAKQKLKLPEGTVIWLSGGTVFKYPEKFTDGKREVELTGEAYFDVAHLKEMPFRVKTGSIITEVLGTEFNVNAMEKDSLIQISLVEGKVKVIQKDKKENILHPDQQLVYNKNTAIAKVQPFDVLKVAGWKDNILVFENELLKTCIQKLEDRYKVKIALENNSIEKCRLTTVLRTETLQQVLLLLEHNFDITYQFENGIVTLSGTGCQ